MKLTSRPPVAVLLLACVFCVGASPLLASPPPEFDRAALHTLHGEHEAALAEYRAFAEKKPDDRLAPVAVMAMAGIYLRVLEDTAQGEAALDRVATEYEESGLAPQAAREKAALAEAREDWRAAGEAYGKALELSGHVPEPPTADWLNEVTLSAADCFYRAGNEEQVITLYRKTLSGDPEPTVAATALHRLGEAYERAGREGEAAESYRRVIESYPQVREIYSQSLGKRDLVERHAELDWQPYIDYAQIFDRANQRDFAGAIELCDRVEAGTQNKTLRECADFTRIMMEAGLTGDYAAAVEKAETFLDEHPETVTRDQAERSIEFWEPIADLEEQAKEEPENAQVLAQLGGMYLRGRNVAQAVETLEKAASLDPESAAIQVQLGYAYLFAGESEKAVEAFEFYLKENPNDTNVLNQIGYSYLRMGNPDQALPYFERYVELAPDEANAHDSMGEGLLESGRLEEAAQQYEKAVEIDPTFGNSYYMLGRVYRTMGEVAQSIEAYERFLELSPVGPQADQALAAIEEMKGVSAETEGEGR